MCLYQKSDATFNFIIAICTLSLSTVVFNSRDWSEILWLPEILHFNNQSRNRKNPLECIGWAIMMLYLDLANFENFKIYLYFICHPACHKTRLH